MKTIQIRNGVGRYTDKSPFPIGGELEVQFDGIPTAQNDVFRAIVKIDGKEIAQYDVSQTKNTIVIQKDQITAGNMVCVITQYKNGMPAAKFVTEPLLLTALDSSFEADPAIESLQKRATNAEGKISYILQKTSTFLMALQAEEKARKNADSAASAQLTKLNAAAVALLAFAYDCYQTLPYMACDGWKGFCARYSVPQELFSKAEIKKIQGDNQ